MNKKSTYDFALIVCVFLICACFPINIFTNNPILISILSIVLQIGFSIFLALYLRKIDTLHAKPKTFKFKNFLLLLPALLVCFSNFSYFIFKSDDFLFSLSSNSIFQICLFVLVAINEELIFRFILLNNLEYESPFKRILVSASIFGAFHISIFLSTFNPADLVVILYTFALGIVLGLLFEYSGSIYACIGLHFLFNLFNDVIFVDCSKGISNYFIYYACNVCVAIIVGLYIFLIYYFVLRKNNLSEFKDE